MNIHHLALTVFCGTNRVVQRIAEDDGNILRRNTRQRGCDNSTQPNACPFRGCAFAVDNRIQHLAARKHDQLVDGILLLQKLPCVLLDTLDIPFFRHG